MNGMRKVGRSSTNKKEVTISDDELDFDQGIEEALEENLPEFHTRKIREDCHIAELKHVVSEPDKLLSTNKSAKTNSIEKVNPDKNSNVQDKLKLFKNDFNQETLIKVNDLADEKLGLTNLQSIGNLKAINRESLELRISDDIILNAPDAEALELLENGSVSSIDSVLSQSEDGHLRSVYVKNVDFNANPGDLEEHFKACGDINRITILIDKYTGLPKGYAYVEFSTIEAKENAKLLNDTILKGKQIKVEEKRKNIPDYYAKNIRRPVYTNDLYRKGGQSYFGPIKGKYMPNRNFKPY